MTISELVQLIHAADKKQRGCEVVFTTHNMATHVSMYGVVTYGMEENKRVFHTEEELREIMGRISK